MPVLDPLIGDMSLTRTRRSAARPQPGLQISLNSKVRLINHRGYGHHTPAALIAMIYLCCGGITVQLPTQT